MEYTYEIVIYYDANDKIFVAKVPELPHCMAHGKTREEALKEAKISIEGWVEVATEAGWDIPIPQNQLMPCLA